MPGLVGYVKDFDDDSAEVFLSAMIQRLEPEHGGYRVEMFHDRHAGLGRVGLGVLNPEAQPHWNADRSLCLVMAGELFDSEEVREELNSRGIQLSVESDGELILALFEVFGEEFAAKLNGSFVVAIWDTVKRKLTIINDRLGLYPLYYSVVNDHLIFASGVRALLAEDELPRSVDSLALAQFLTFDHLLDSRTMLSSVRLLPQASVLSFSERNLQIRPYWSFEYPETYQNRSAGDLLEEFIVRMRQAVKRQAPGEIEAGLLLSGGLDSRLLLAVLGESTDLEKLHTFTWGIPGCDDARVAAKLARLARTRHHFFELKPDYLAHMAENAVRLTEGNGNLVNLHALATLEEAAEHSNLIYKGFLGDAMMGFALQRPFWADYDADTALSVHLGVHDFQGVLNYKEHQLGQLLTESLSGEIGSGVLDTYRDGMQRSGCTQLAAQRLYFDFTQRVPRMTLNGVEVVRSLAAVRLPFADKDLVDFSLSVPPGYHFERYLVRTAFVHSYPAFAKIPAADSGLPMISCALDIGLRTKQFLQWHLNRTGIRWLSSPTRRPYKDYANWFRTVLKSWVEENLLSRKALERGHFQPDSVRKLVSEHMAGADHTVRLGALMTIEKWHQLFID